MASEEVLVTPIKKEPGKLYFCRANADGFITIYSTKAGRPIKIREEDVKISIEKIPDDISKMSTEEIVQDMSARIDGLLE